MDVIGTLATVFARSGFEIYLVGGSVRDRLLGRSSHDLDLTTNARPPDIKRLLNQARAGHIFDVGERFGTVGGVFGDLNVEITTYRREWYPNPSRKPDVEFGDVLEDDLARRDFTVNAIAQDVSSGRIIDPHRGVGDLARKVLRAVGNADERFEEDPLRMLRAVRLSAQLEFAIEKSTRDAIELNSGRLQYISAERIRDELMKILTSDHPDEGIVELFRLKLVKFAIPELTDLPGTIQDEQHRHKDVLAHTLRVLAGVPPDPVLRLAALLHDVGKPQTKSVTDGRIHFYRHEDVGARMAREILRRLKFDNDTIQDVTKLVALHMRSNLYEAAWTDGAIRRFIREVGQSRDGLLMLSRADITSYRPRKVEAGLVRVAELEARCQLLVGQEDVEKLDSPLDGTELMELFGRAPGKWIKPIKDYLLELVLDGELGQDDKETAKRLAVEFANPPPGGEVDGREEARDEASGVPGATLP